LVWLSILRQVDLPGSSSDFVTVADFPREFFLKHPWSIGGGGAAELKEELEELCESRLGDFASSIGFASFPASDDVFLVQKGVLRRSRVPVALIRPAVLGENVRDWSIQEELEGLTPYDTCYEHLAYSPTPGWGRYLWPFRTTLRSVVSFGSKTREES